MITTGLYDLIVLALVALFAWRGYQKGLVNQLGTLIVLFVVAVISIRYTPSLADFIPGNVNGNTSSAIAFVIIILVSTLIVWNIVNSLTKVVNKLKLKSWNNQMGALLGIVNGIFCSMLLTFLLLVYAVPQPEKNENRSFDVTYENLNSFEKKREDHFVMKSFLGRQLTSATLATIECLPKGQNGKFYSYLRDMLKNHADKIKSQNPELTQEKHHAPGKGSIPNQHADHPEQQGQARHHRQGRPENYSQDRYDNNQQRPGDYQQGRPGDYQQGSDYYQQGRSGGYQQDQSYDYQQGSEYYQQDQPYDYQQGSDYYQQGQSYDYQRGSEYYQRRQPNYNH